jgi:hypothetical protein
MAAADSCRSRAIPASERCTLEAAERRQSTRKERTSSMERRPATTASGRQLVVPTRSGRSSFSDRLTGPHRSSVVRRRCEEMARAEESGRQSARPARRRFNGCFRRSRLAAHVKGCATPALASPPLDAASRFAGRRPTTLNGCSRSGARPRVDGRGDRLKRQFLLYASGRDLSNRPLPALAASITGHSGRPVTNRSRHRLAAREKPLGLAPMRKLFSSAHGGLGIREPFERGRIGRTVLPHGGVCHGVTPVNQAVGSGQ